VPALVCDNYDVLVRLAERSDTILFGPRNVLAAYERAGRLKVMSWPLEGPESGPSLIRSRGRHLSPAAERLMLLFGNGPRFRDGLRPPTAQPIGPYLAIIRR
jgi:DNA-binding transcriptional LysR family regulator